MSDTVTPEQTALPERLRRLPELANDLWWTWNSAPREVFRRLDYPLWRQTAHNPVLMLRLVSNEMIEAAVADPSFLALYDSAIAALDRGRSGLETWWSSQFADTPGPLAYFSAEFALHQSLPIYAGGLGVLAGDHCKEASDLGVPLIGVGFMYPQGYFHQNLSPEGWQMEVYERLSWADAPVDPALTPDGKPCVIAVPLGNRSVLASVWRVRLGRVTLFLLDTDLEENTPWDRELSARLYGGDREIRIQQEIILGIGGVRALKALGLTPAAWHLNEGHAAFVVLQRIRDLIEHGETFESALEEVRRTTIFTTHTPVPAGHDAFPFNLVETHLAGAWGTRGASRDAVIALGPARPASSTASVSCTGRSRATCGGRSGRASRATDGPSGRSRTASTCRPGSPRTCARCSTRTSSQAGWSAMTTRRSGRPSSTSPTTSCGGRAIPSATTFLRSSASAPATAGASNGSARRGSSRPARSWIRTR